MASPWWDYFRLFTYAFSSDPLSRRQQRDATGAGISQDGAIPDIRAGGDGTFGEGRGSIRLRDTNDFVDLSTVTNRMHRYQEYERLRNMPEIEMAMTVFADETCLAGETLVATPHGYKAIKDLCKETERFLVYCYDFEKNDYTLGWAHSARLTKKTETVKITFDNGNYVICTLDHRILMRNSEWRHAEDVEVGDELMPFYRIPANQNLTKLKTNQHPRIYTHNKGWVNERQLVDEWSSGKENPDTKDINKYCRLIAGGMNIRQIKKITGNDFKTIQSRLEKAGFSNSELKWLGKKKDVRRVVGIQPWEEIEVYDLTVERHHNFCTDWGVVHNCQKDEDGRVFQVICGNEAITKELEYLLFHRSMLNMDQQKSWNMAKKTFIMGDFFWEIVIDMDDPKQGIIGLVPLPADSMYRIETTKGKLVEFQQSKEGPDYQSLSRVEVAQATDADLQTATAIRFAPDQIIHTRIGDDRKTFYPYGVSLIEAARGPAHQLRLMEDSMIVYRLSRAPERRVFYIDTFSLPPYKAEAFMERMKDQFKKKKVGSGKGGLMGASAVEERWHAPAADEDFWIPVRPNSNTRVETLPGACLALDTKIPLLDGRILTLSEIIEEFNTGKQLWAYSCNPKTGQFVPGPITWAGVTRKNTQVVKVTFDNGESVVCTPDHKFPVQGKDGKIEAQNLEIGDSLIPFNTRTEKVSKNTAEYTQVYDVFERKWIFVHRLVGKYKNIVGETVYREEYAKDDKNVIHHVNFDPLNNCPNNLTKMNWIDHACFHKDLPRSAETKEKISKGLKEYHLNLTQEQIEKRNKILAKRSLLGTEKIQHLLLNDKEFKFNFSQSQIKGWETAADRNPELHIQRGLKISKNNKQRFSNQEYKNNVFEKQTIKYPNSMFEIICNGFSVGLKRDDIIEEINSNQGVIDEYVKLNQNIVRKTVNLIDGITVDHFNKLVISRGYSGSRELRKCLIGVIKDRSNQCNENKIYGKSTLNFPKKIFSYFMHRLADGIKNVDEILIEIKNNPSLMKEWMHENMHVDRKGVIVECGLKRTHVSRMIKSYGYKDLNHARQEAKLYNHKVVSVEFLSEKIDTGTLTIDGSETYHNYHTFAISGCGVMTYNSNLGEVDDTIYFRNKLFTALNFPKNYFNNEDVQSTRITLSAQDVKFARMIERLQAHIQDAFWEICDRHLRLKGYPEELYDDLEVKMTPPSDWRELTRAEVVSGRIQNAGALKGSQLMSDYDILTKLMKYGEEETLKMLARLKIQKLEELKLQIVAQNPTLLGVGLPGSDETEIGSQPGGPNPMLGDPASDPASDPAAGGAPESPGGNQPQILGGGKPSSGTVLPEPSEEDILRFNLDVHDFASEMDDEEIEEF